MRIIVKITEMDAMGADGQNFIYHTDFEHFDMGDTAISVVTDDGNINCHQLSKIKNWTIEPNMTQERKDKAYTLISKITEATSIIRDAIYIAEPANVELIDKLGSMTVEIDKLIESLRHIYDIFEV